MRKGQTAFETFVTVMMFIAFTVPVALLLLSTSNLKLEHTTLFHARTTTQQFADSINEVYLQGDGAVRNIILNIPSNTKNLSVSNNTVTLFLRVADGEYAISHPFFANAGDFNISDRVGLMPITIKMQNGAVNITRVT